MSNRKIALDLLVKINSEGITLEQLNEELSKAERLMEEIGDDGSKEFQALKTVIDDARGSIENANESMGTLNGKTKELNGSLEDTDKATKGASKGVGLFSKGIKGVGLALKALGIGIVIAGLKLLQEAVMRNQKTADALAAVMGTVSNVFNRVVTSITDAVTSVSKASNGFEGLKKVIGGLLTLSITPLRLAFNSIKLTILQSQLAWENSFFGKGDEGKIKELTLSISDTKSEIKELGQDAVKAGVDVVQNIGKAGEEISRLTSQSIEGISNINIASTFEQEKANVNLRNTAKLAAAQQQLLVEKYDQQAEALRQVRDEERNSITDRIKTNNDLGEVLNKQEKSLIRLADLRIASAQADFSANGSIENQVALTEALAEKQGVLAQIEGFRSEQKMNDLQLDKERIQLNKAIEDSESKLSIERRRFNAEQIENKLQSLKELDKIEQDYFERELQRLEAIVESTKSGTQAEIDALIALSEFREEFRQSDIERQKEIAAETIRIDNELKTKQKANNDQLAKNNEELAQQRLNNAMSLFNSLNQLQQAFQQGNEQQQRRAFKISKALNIGQSIVQTAAGVTKALAETTDPTPVQALRFGNAIAVGLAGAAQVATIAQTQFNGGGSFSTPNISQNSSFNPSNIGGINTNGIQPSAFSLPQNDVKVIVTETDIRKATGNVSGIYQNATVVE